ncbi:uncharacterized protein LODBEIA_P13500 [Lodderomyces beijingensis]|uniref:Uncharacterized protein n=1 Tax=Lodderomyces beijingensis TaxID=1775926 RepID=A0ABP0ZJT9_9ASCO
MNSSMSNATNETSSLLSTTHSESRSIKTKKGLSFVIGNTHNDDNHILPINAMQYSQAQNRLYTGGRDGCVKIWEDPSHSLQTFADSSSSNNGHSRKNDEFSDCEDVDEKLVRLETSISSKPLPYHKKENYDPTGFRIADSHSLHFDWINDITLINNDSQLVSCSSDLSIKIIDLCNNAFTQNLPNVHTDYIKKLAYSPRSHARLVSGGLDGNIVCWDLNYLRPLHIIENHTTVNLPFSIYSLASNDQNIISTGGPSKTINLYDTRSSTPFIRQLIGHQDNIRCLLMNEHFILSGSSDTTIKLWDLRTFKVYKNFEIHDYPVWSLASPTSSNTNLREFYSGDNRGNIIKTDLSCLYSNNDTDKFYRDTFSASEISCLDEKLGVSMVIASNESPILSICAETQNNTVFASDYKSLNRYVTPDTSTLAQYQYLKNCVDLASSREAQFKDDSLLDELHQPAQADDMNSHFCDLVSQLTLDTTPNNFDLHSTFSHSNNQNNNIGIGIGIGIGNNFAGTPPTFDSDHVVVDDDGNDEMERADNSSENAEELSSMFLSIGGGPSGEFINALKPEPYANLLADKMATKKASDPSLQQVNESCLDLTPVEILLNPLPADQVIISPFNTRPSAKYDISPKSVVSKRLFDNKRQIMVLYLNGDIKIWDLLTCMELRHFPSRQERLLSTPELEDRVKEMDVLFQNYQKSDTLNNWCEVEIKAGKLMVTIRETSAMNVEIYYDDLVSEYPFLAIDSPSTRERLGNYKIQVTNDDRFHVGLIMLNSIFYGYTLYEWVFDGLMREEIRNGGSSNGKTPPQSQPQQPPTPPPQQQLQQLQQLQQQQQQQQAESIQESLGSVSSMRRLKTWGRKSSKRVPSSRTPSVQSSPVNSTNASVLDLSIGEVSPLAEILNTPEQMWAKQIPDYGDSVMSLLQTNKKIYQDRHNANYKQLDSVFKVDHVTPKLNDKLDKDELKYHPVIPFAQFPKDMSIIIYEHSPELGNYRDVSCFKLEDVANLVECPNPQLVNELRSILPRWIGQPTLYGRYNIKESPKITFQLQEVDYANLPAHVKIGGKSQRKIKQLPALESSIKLTSHNMLRVSKILYFLNDKFDSSTREMRDKKLKPTDWLVLECRGRPLSNNMTLQTIKTKIWKSSTDIELHFRRKFDV